MRDADLTGDLITRSVIIEIIEKVEIGWWLVRSSMFIVDFLRSREAVETEKR